MPGAKRASSREGCDADRNGEGFRDGGCAGESAEPRAAVARRLGEAFFLSNIRLPNGFWRSAARYLYAPTPLTHPTAKHEARKRRADERHRVGCYAELGRTANRKRKIQ